MKRYLIESAILVVPTGSSLFDTNKLAMLAATDLETRIKFKFEEQLYYVDYAEMYCCVKKSDFGR